MTLQTPTVDAEDAAWQAQVSTALRNARWLPSKPGLARQVLTYAIEQRDGAAIRSALDHGARLSDGVKKRTNYGDQWLADPAMIWLCKSPPEGFMLKHEDVKVATLSQDDLDECVYQLLVRLVSRQDGWLTELLAAGANPNLPRAMSPTRMRPLHVLAGRGKAGNMARQLAAAQALLAAGATIDALDSEAASPLHLALEAHDAAYAHWLLDRGADPLKRDALGRTPLHRWAAQRRGYEWQLCPHDPNGEMWRLLGRQFDAGASLDDPDLQGHTVMEALAVPLGDQSSQDPDTAEAAANKHRWHGAMLAWARAQRSPCVTAPPARPRSRS